MGSRPRVCHTPSHQKENLPLATPNYSYEKRQRELAKKRKKEEKLKKKAERGSDQPSDAESGDPSALDTDTAGDAPASAADEA